MYDFSSLLEEVLKIENNDDIMKNWSETISYYLDKIKESDEEMYNNIIEELYMAVHGEHLTKEIAQRWVSTMKPIGEHWTIEETTRALPTVESIDGYVVSNMIYNDYYDILKNNDNIVMKMTINWLNDEDAEENKIFNYWKYIIKR